MTILKIFLILGFILFLERGVFAEEVTEVSSSTSSAVPVVKKWAVGFDSFHYDFQGRHPADGNIYGFERVTADIQLLTLRYQYTPTLSFSAVGSYTRSYAETNFDQTLFKDKTEGVNDATLKATKTFMGPLGMLISEFGMTLPTGSIAEKNRNNPAFNYPYNMQLGSGTYDFIGSLTGLKMLGRNQLGLFGMARVRTGRNDYNYRRSDEYSAKAWYTFMASPYWSPGIWMNYLHRQRFSGQDRTYGRNLFTQFYHSSRDFWEFSAYVNFQLPLFSGLALRGMIGKPLWQESKNIDNVQVYSQWFTQVGLEGTF